MFVPQLMALAEKVEVVYTIPMTCQRESHSGGLVEIH